MFNLHAILNALQNPELCIYSVFNVERYSSTVFILNRETRKEYSDKDGSESYTLPQLN